MEKQFNLNGVAGNNNEEATGSALEIFLFSKKDRIWETLMFLYRAEIFGVIGLNAEQLSEAHEKKKPLSERSIRDNLKRLIKRGLVINHINGLGKTRRMKAYKITMKGMKVMEEFSREIQ